MNPKLRAACTAVRRVQNTEIDAVVRRVRTTNPVR